jgi:hypothetical protein
MDSSKRPLTLVSDDVYRLDRKPETPAERIRRLQVEAKLLAREQIGDLERAMIGLAAKAREVTIGGDAYPPGIREMASRLAEDLEAKAQSMDAVLERVTPPTL